MIKTKNISQAWLIWTLAAAFYFYEFFLQVSPNVMVPELMHAFNLSAAALGNLTACYFYSYAAMQIPSGVLLDRYGARNLLTIATALCMIGCILFGVNHFLWLAIVGRLCIGFGAAFAILGCFKLISTWFPSQQFAFISGLTVTIGMIGAMAGQAPLAFLVESIGWQLTMILLGVVGGILSFFIWCKVRDVPKDVAVSIHHTQKPAFAGLKQVLQSKQTWLAAIYGGLMFAPTSILGALWGVPFLIANYGVSRPLAAGIISSLFVGWAIGSPLNGFFADYLGLRRQVLYVGTVGALIFLTLFIYAHLSVLLLIMVLFAFGFFSSGFLPSFAIVREINASQATATALGFMNMMNMLGGAFGQPFIGKLLDLNWDGKLVNGVRIYSSHDFHVSLLLLPICLAIAFIILLFVKIPPTHQH